MPLYTRFVQPVEFNPFRVLDEYASFINTKSNHAVRSFQPRFNVEEKEDSYQLTGEFPGVKQEDISIEFDNEARTLTIKGRTESRREEGTRPTAQAQVEAPAEPQPEAAESETSSYHKVSVEDEDEPTMSGANPDATPAETPAESVAEPETQQVAEAPKPASRYWISERSSGSFARTFKFRGPIDQEQVKASLQDGILSVVLPKKELPPNKRIEIQ